jgi:ATP-dependent DNA helicase RecG
MTATPIPRTIALTVYGDLDLSTIDEMPKGRKDTKTWIVPPHKRMAAYEWIKKQINNNHLQVFVICPFIEESENELLKNVKAATAEYKKLKNIFNKNKVDLLHGKLKSEQKDKIIESFKNKKTDILVTTPIVEVGIDIPNANIMLIEAAERFGLASLHQLRGRVGRGKKQSYCFLFTQSSSKKSNSRLNALKKESSGFALAEIDLRLRGPGEIFGLRQHGFPELKIASWQQTDLITKAKKTAEKIATNPIKFKKALDHYKNKLVSTN